MQKVTASHTVAKMNAFVSVESKHRSQRALAKPTGIIVLQYDP
jgi:hypothetical protein